MIRVVVRFLSRLWYGDRVGQQLRLALSSTGTSVEFRRMLHGPLREYLEKVLYADGVCGVHIGLDPVDLLCTTRKFGKYPPEYVVHVVTFLRDELFEPPSHPHFAALTQAEFNVFKEHEQVPIEFHIAGDSTNETWEQTLERVSPRGTVSIFSLTPTGFAA